MAGQDANRNLAITSAVSTSSRTAEILPTTIQTQRQQQWESSISTIVLRLPFVPTSSLSSSNQPVLTTGIGTSSAISQSVSEEPMDIGGVLDHTIPISDVPLDTQSLGLDNELSVEAFNKLVTEVDNEVVTDFVIKEPGNGEREGNIFVQETETNKLDALTNAILEPKMVTAEIIESTLQTPLPVESEIRRRLDGALVKVTSVSLISDIFQQSHNNTGNSKTLVVDMNELARGAVFDTTTTGVHPVPVDQIPENAKLHPDGIDPATTVENILIPQCVVISPSPQTMQYFKCPNCDLLSSTEKMLVKHIENTHAGPTSRSSRHGPVPSRPYKCNVEDCSWSFDSSHRLNRHIETHQLAKTFFCTEEDCGRSFTTKHNLKTHLKVCHDPKLHKITCVVDGCDKTFKLKKQMEEHVAKLHPTLKKYVCTIGACNKSCLSLDDLNKHVASHERTFVCTVCGKRFVWESRFTEHMNVHNGVKPHKCSFNGCEWSFGTLSRLRRHERIHTDDRPFACDWQGCTSSFYRKEHLLAHVNGEHKQLKPYHCPVENCRSRFTSKSGLGPHLKKHYAQGSKTVYNCPFESCSKQCSAEGTLRCHIQAHISQGDPGILKILEARNDISEETLRGLRLAEKSQIPGRPRTLLPVILSTLQSNAIGVKHPYQYLQQAALDAAVTVQVNAVEPILLTSTDDEIATTSVSLQRQMDTGEMPCSSQGESNKLSVDILSSEVEHGSARTDYIVNHLASEHSRTRRRLQKDLGNMISLVSIQNLVRVRSITHESVDEELEDDGDDDDFETEIVGFNLNELLRPPDMTLRDPETGVSYDQTQLLQDDPPNPIQAS